MDVAVIAAERLRQRADARTVIPANVAQKFHVFARQNAGEHVPAFERHTAFPEALAAFGAMPGFDEPPPRSGGFA